MQKAHSVAQRVLATHGKPYPACSHLSVRFYSGSPIRLRRHRGREQHGDSSRPPRPRQRSQPPRFQQRRPLLFAEDPPRDQLSPKMVTSIIIQELQKISEQTEKPEYKDFMQHAVSAIHESLKLSRKAAPIVESLRQSFIGQGRLGLRTQIKYAYHGYLASQRFSKSNLQDQARLADIRYPAEWYPATRQMQRTIHLHVGPTNSGKTYHALKRLEEAQFGVYAGPLRLLAHEVYMRLNARGRPCNLVTGDERQLAEGDDVTMSSCTVEMVPVNTSFDVAVIDEIQMIGHEERGWAWTQAVLALKAKELHLCGEERAVPLIKELAAAMGDDLQIHHYQRLSPLKTMSTSLKSDLGNLRKGDCVVAFSKVQIHSLKRELEIKTKKPVAVVYGSLPPEVRARQAELFNDPNNNYDILVASDAIGMGLNLSIKRIIFARTTKFNGHTAVPVEISQIKQIAGRAGRYRTAAQAAAPDTAVDDLSGAEAKDSSASPNVSSAKTLGLVTTLNRGELSVIRNAMESQADPIMTAGIVPPVDVIVRFAAYFPPSTPFSYILFRLYDTSILHPRFHLCTPRDRLKIADIIEPIRKLTISDRVNFCASPANVSDEGLHPILRAFAECVANRSGGGILDIKALNLGLLDVQVTVGSRDYLQKLERLHKALILYLWLSYRFAGVFSTQAMAFYMKKIVEEKIQQALSKVSTNIRTTARTPIRRVVQQESEPKFLNPEDTDDEPLEDTQSSGPSRERHHIVLGSGTVKRETRRKPGTGLDVAIADLIPDRLPMSGGAAP